MGEGCCGGGDKATSTPPVPGLQTNGVKAQANGTHTPPVSHKQAAAELQNFINKRIQLFESYHEREKERVSPQACVPASRHLQLHHLRCPCLACACPVCSDLALNVHDQ